MLSAALVVLAALSMTLVGLAMTLSVLLMGFATLSMLHATLSTGLSAATCSCHCRRFVNKPNSILYSSFYGSRVICCYLI